VQPAADAPEVQSAAPLAGVFALPVTAPVALVVDDNRVNRMVLNRLLASAGWRVDEAESGEDAIEATRSKEYAIVFMDIQMPGVDGLQAAEAIRACEVTGGPHPWIVAVTANAMAGDRERYLAGGMDDYLGKPVRQQSVEQTLAAYHARRLAA
jgi:CheY-like chemotaxis protein